MKTFKLATALKKLKDGKKIRSTIWNDNFYIYSKDGLIVNQNGETDSINIFTLGDIDTQWEVFTPEIKAGIYRSIEDPDELIFYDGTSIFSWDVANKWLKILDRFSTQKHSVFNKDNFLSHYELEEEDSNVDNYEVKIRLVEKG